MKYRTPRKADLEALLLAGEKLSNLAYNLKQQPARTLSHADCESMRLGQEEWDRARRNLRRVDE